MISDDPDYEEVAKKYIKGLNRRLNSTSAEVREKEWWFFVGNRLVENLELVSTQKVSYLEVVGSISGELRWEDSGYCALSANFMDLLFKSAHVSPLDFDLAKKICTRNLANERLQPELQVLAALILSGKLTRPRKKDGVYSNDWYRNLLVVRAVDTAKRYGFKPTRGQIPSEKVREKPRKKSGCSLVREAFAKAGNEMVTEEVVLDVWKKRANLREADQFLQLLDFQVQVEPEPPR